MTNLFREFTKRNDVDGGEAFHKVKCEERIDLESLSESCKSKLDSAG